MSSHTAKTNNTSGRTLETKTRYQRELHQLCFINVLNKQVIACVNTLIMTALDFIFTFFLYMLAQKTRATAICICQLTTIQMTATAKQENK